MENLHLSYREVFEEIPYRVMVMMSKDKAHIAYGGVVKQEKGKDMMSRRMAMMKQKQ